MCVEDVGPVEAVWAFVNAYDKWAQRGYTPSIPEELVEAVTEKGLPGLDSDARWYSRGKVRQVGSMVVSEVELLSYSSSDAVVGALLDTTGIRVLANGKETFRSTEEKDLIHRVRIGLVFDGRWRIDVIDTVE
ncbi:hypothetical protein [Rathayibacter sp. VKM Ac-2928]|uniref:hypothetical protein n=1 Tax=Rathayibacter sp. VKM Ac-2928 TaxID=2929479 RepID=UPI001FB20321|nr:hypothetical protein [Rathayibacter sp. VKM Ac-2928]MCJ1683354.1 hypothetical protein [Rathayibacter sp. VKM Ac-2928]